jgi:outer membrane protein TolC
MTVPFGDFTRSPRVKQREAQKLQAQEQAAALADAATADLLRYRREYESAKAALPAAREAVENAQRSLELFKPLFRQGRQSVLEVVRAEAALMSARSSLAEITFKLHFYYAASLFMAGEFDQTAADNISAALGGTK